MNAWGWATGVVVVACMVLVIYIDLKKAKNICEETKSYLPYWLSAMWWIAVLTC